MLGIEGLSLAVEILYTLPNLTSTRRLMVAYSSISGMQLGNAAWEVLCHIVSEQH